MKFFKLTTLAASVAALLLSQNVQATAFEDDSQNFHVEGQSLNEALGNVNTIICYMSAMRPDAFVNDDAYRATVYEEDCETSTADATSESSSATATSSSSASTASAATAGTAVAKTASKALLNVSRQDNISPVLGKAWVESPSDSPYEPDILVYVDISQTSAPSITSPNGDFEMKYSSHADLSKDLKGDFSQYVQDGQIFGQGYILAEGSVLKFKELGGGDENNVTATFLPSGDKFGVYGEDASYSTFDFATAEATGDFSGRDNPDNQVNITGYYQFYMSAADKGYCRKLYVAETVAWPDTSLLPADPGEDFDWGAFWEPTRTEVYNSTTGVDSLADYAASGLTTTEECFSTDRKRAQRNVHRYGVYNDDGSRLAITNPGFPLRATVSSTDENGEAFPVEVFGYADYWGVHVDPMGRALIDDTTVFRKETFNANDTASTDEANYNLVSSDIKIERRSTSYLPLNDLDGLNFAMHINDPWWSAEYIALFGSTPAYEEYEGSFDKETLTFTLTKGLKFQPQYEQIELETQITFTIAQWQAAMQKTYGTLGDDWYFVEIKSLGVWSHDTRQWYEILPAGMANPTLASAPTADAAGVGMRTETTEFILPADLTETLYCLRECLTGEKVRQTMGQALQLVVAEKESGTVSSPYANVGEYLKADVDSVTVERGHRSLSEVTDGNSTIAAGTSLQLGIQGMSVTDYINGNISLPHYMRASFDGVPETNLAAFQMLGDYHDAGLSRTNLNKMLGDGSGGSGIAPELRLDLKSIPSTGVGTLKMTVSVIEGNDATLAVGEEALRAVATLNWASDGTTFTASLPDASTSTVSLVLEDGTTVQAERAITGDQTILSAAVGDSKSSAWKVFNLISGGSDLTALNDAGLADFFEEDQNYTMEVKIEDTTLAIQGPGASALTGATLSFSVVEDTDVTRSQTYIAGTRFDGVLAAEMITYSYNDASGKIADTDGISLEKGAEVSTALLSIENPEQLLQEIVFNNPEGWQQSVGWGLRTAQLVTATDLAKMECRKNGKDQLYDQHPVYGSATDVKRYCSYKLFDGSVQTTYSLSVQARPTYAIQSATTGLAIDIDEPKTLYYQVPETLDAASGEFVFGKDAGKRIRLEFRGHGELGGIPGFVYNTKTGEELGEFVNDWKDGYRYISRFTIPDGGILEDALDSTKTYKVKALDGEEWLTKADGTIVGLDFRDKYTYQGSKADLAIVDDMSTPGDPQNTEQYIGAPPTVLINEGETSVIHGEIVFDPTPEVSDAN